MAKGSGTEAHEKFQVTVQVSWALQFSKYLYFPEGSTLTISFSFVQSVPCGSSGVACSKSVMLRLGSPGTEESITLTRHKKIPIGKFSERYFCFLFSYTAVSTTYQTCPISNRVSRNHPSKEPRRVLSLPIYFSC